MDCAFITISWSSHIHVGLLPRNKRLCVSRKSRDGNNDFPSQILIRHRQCVVSQLEMSPMVSFSSMRSPHLVGITLHFYFLMVRLYSILSLIFSFSVCLSLLLYCHFLLSLHPQSVTLSPFSFSFSFVAQTRSSAISFAHMTFFLFSSRRLRS